MVADSGGNDHCLLRYVNATEGLGWVGQQLRSGRLNGDKGHSYGPIRAYARLCGIRIAIPWRSNEHRHGPLGQATYRQYNGVEWLICLMEQCRRQATQ